MLFVGLEKFIKVYVQELRPKAGIMCSVLKGVKERVLNGKLEKLETARHVLYDESVEQEQVLNR